MREDIFSDSVSGHAIENRARNTIALHCAEAADHWYFRRGTIFFYVIKSIWRYNSNLLKTIKNFNLEEIFMKTPAPLRVWLLIFEQWLCGDRQARASTDNQGYFWVRCPMWPMEPHVAQKTISERNEMALTSFHHWTRLNELIILVWPNRIKMAKLWPPKDLPKVAARLILSQLLAILTTFFDMWTLNLLCPLLQ